MSVHSLDIWHYEQLPFTQYNHPTPAHKKKNVFISIVRYLIYPCTDLISSVLHAYIHLHTDISFGFLTSLILVFFFFFWGLSFKRKEKRNNTTAGINKYLGSVTFSNVCLLNSLSAHDCDGGEKQKKKCVCANQQMCFSWFHVYRVTPSPVACTEQTVLKTTQSHRLLLFFLCCDLRSITTAGGYNKLNKMSLQVPFIFLLSMLSRAESSQYRSVKIVCSSHFPTMKSPQSYNLKYQGKW